MTLKEIKSVLREYNIRPSKRLGQSFLIDNNIRDKIIDAIDVSSEDVIFEIGPGLGSLTGELCKRTKKVIGIEKDKRLYEFLVKNNPPSNLELVQGDILKYDFATVSAKSKVKVVGNLPYYISSPILIRLLKNRDFIDTVFITVQKEFGERLIAGVGTKAYGSITCFVQFYAEVSRLFLISKSTFYPQPKVDSCFLKLRLRDKALYPVRNTTGVTKGSKISNGVFLTDEEKLFKIIKVCFEKRRKTILNSLYSSGIFASKKELQDKLERVGISKLKRPEAISLEQFVKLVDVIV